MIDRRTFLVGAAGSLASLIAAAQPLGRKWRIGFLGGYEEDNPAPAIFRDGMRSLGYVEGRDYVIEFRWGHGDPKRSFALATELVGLKVDVIVTAGSESTRAARQATPSIPIVFYGPSYPVEEGLVASFARPGGNITGITVAMSDTVSKHLQLLRDMLPTLADLAMIWSPANPGNTFAFRDTERAAASLQLKLHSVPIGSAEKLNRGLAEIARLRPGALIVQPSAALVLDDVHQVSELAIKLRIPSITIAKAFTERGVLMSYGADLRDLQRRVPVYVDRILNGTKPADLPVERPTKFELVINLKTAKALGLTIPQSMLLRADEVIQ